MKIYLIRHGRTIANEQHLYCGSTDLPLSQDGEAELSRMLEYGLIGADKLILGSDVRYLTSGMRRTEQTLELLFGNVSHEVVPAFREMNFGSFEMHSYEELKEDQAYQAWITGDNESNVTPGGESGVQMTERVLTAWKELQGSETDVVLVTHGGVIAAIMAHEFPEERKNRYEWQPKPGMGYLIDERCYQAL